jgi:hypothetical protein
MYWVQYPAAATNFLLKAASRQVLGTDEPPTPWIPEVLLKE